MPKIETHGQMANLLEAIREGRCHFLGYQQPMAMIAEGSVVHDVPIGHLIPGLMRIASGQSNGAGQDESDDVGGDTPAPAPDGGGAL